MTLPDVPVEYRPRDLGTLNLPPVELQKFNTEYLFTYVMKIPSQDPPLVVGDGSEGISMIISERGSRITGPRINGTFARDGQDYVTLRRDGTSVHEVRCVILTNDGAKIKFTYEGRGDFGPTGHQDVLDGKMPNNIRIRCAPHLQTDHPDYLWVNRLQCIEVGEVYNDKGYGSFDCYALV
ncbi:hypothetical protein PEBR_07256 [Penicillium brasilianum]|uniref:Uncharacterized protein n=1 Tax=Penicillium brasilianum TaxID=104259 RepID=A0A1S9RW47_PENBI|nr:hypothetical protein PEBR_07256 [Penicillium brasilianum]